MGNTASRQTALVVSIVTFLLSLLLSLGVAFIVDGILNWRYPLEGLTLRVGGGAIDILGANHGGDYQPVEWWKNGGASR